MDLKVALVTGGNRGLGLACVRLLAELGYIALLGARDVDCGRTESERLRTYGLTVRSVRLDIADASSVTDCFREIDESFGRLDVLINNAGIYLESACTFSEIDEKTLLDSINVNTLGAWRTCKAAAPLMIRQRFGRIVNVSTGWASLAEMSGNAAAYRISKTALNAVTRVAAADLIDKGDIKVNSVCPGWVRTRMGGLNGETAPDDAARDVIWAAMLGSDGPTGGFFKNREPIAW
ncbi:short-chain dehydrogenase [Trinickia symbiotica]|uniref:Short-chain dehydrogenase n=1 Tax=Trinickia symbiotica TaxID=863227 RepID=A0A2T3XW68_9BURK|nr:SDR family NAD(P)-dependent oxidoreductase [Trinickia symbiotica]PTB20712.1 short-chain dehydrogenase [Trinickia symbiotica]